MTNIGTCVTQGLFIKLHTCVREIVTQPGKGVRIFFNRRPWHSKKIVMGSTGSLLEMVSEGVITEIL